MEKAFYSILIVESDRELVDMLRTTLSDGGYSLHVCETGRDALERLSGSSFDVALVDMHISDIGPLEICRRIRELPGPYVPVVMLGHGRNSKALAKALNQGADDFIFGPFETEELLARVEVALRMKHREDHLRKQTETLRDFTRRYQEKNRELRELASKLKARTIEDSQTGLHNTGYFEHRLNEEVFKIERHGGVLAFMRLRVANYSDLVKALGEREAASIVQGVGQILKEHLRISDVPTMIDRHEYAILLLETDRQQSVMFAGRLRRIFKDFAREEILLQGRRLQIAMGIAVYPEDANSGIELGRRVESALEKALEPGRDGIYVHGEEVG